MRENMQGFYLKFKLFCQTKNLSEVKNTVFEITDRNVLGELLSASSKTRTDRIREMID